MFAQGILERRSDLHNSDSTGGIVTEPILQRNKNLDIFLKFEALRSEVRDHDSRGDSIKQRGSKPALDPPVCPVRAPKRPFRGPKRPEIAYRHPQRSKCRFACFQGKMLRTDRFSSPTGRSPEWVFERCLKLSKRSMTVTTAKIDVSRFGRRVLAESCSNPPPMGGRVLGGIIFTRCQRETAARGRTVRPRRFRCDGRLRSLRT